MAIAATTRTSLLDELPSLARGLPPEEAAIARQRAIVDVERLEPGPWGPAVPPDPTSELALMVLGGLMMRSVVLGQTVATELVGRGDLLRPAAHDGADAPVPFDVEWLVLEETRIALLDCRFVAAI